MAPGAPALSPLPFSFSLSHPLSVGVGLLQPFRAVRAGRGKQRELAEGPGAAGVRARAAQSAAGPVPGECFGEFFWLILQIPMF